MRELEPVYAILVTRPSYLELYYCITMSQSLNRRDKVTLDRNRINMKTKFLKGFTGSHNLTQYFPAMEYQLKLLFGILLKFGVKNRFFTLLNLHP